MSNARWWLCASASLAGSLVSGQTILGKKSFRIKGEAIAVGNGNVCSAQREGLVTVFICSDTYISTPKPNHLFKDKQLSVKKQLVSPG